MVFFCAPIKIPFICFMYQLIVDSGSTKTDWVLLQNSKIIITLNSIGFNPYFQTQETISHEIENTVLPQLKPYLNKIENCYYYGTACSTEENCLIIKNAIQTSLAHFEVHVEHDLLAAARALCGREAGIAAILGTGSNSCLYDGNSILENVPSAGYLWADYGAGSQIGKFICRDYFEGNMPSDILKKFEASGYNKENILNSVYKKGVPSKYLAQLSLFASENINHTFIKKIVNECFNSFFVQQVNKYSNSKNYKVHTVGSIGFYFKETIAQVAQQNGYTMGTVIKSPMEGLIKYHSL